MNPKSDDEPENTPSTHQDGQGHWYSPTTTTPDLTAQTTQTPSTISLSPYERWIESKIGHCLTSIVSLSLFTSADGSVRGAMMPSSEDVPLMTSTPIVTSAPRSERDMEDALFGDMENLVREFLRRPDRRYPYYRIIRWNEGEHPKLEYVLTVVINRPAIVLWLMNKASRKVFVSSSSDYFSSISDIYSHGHPCSACFTRRFGCTRPLVESTFFQASAHVQQKK